MNFLCIYLCEIRGGGFTNACICIGTQPFPKLGRDELIMVLHMR